MIDLRLSDCYDVVDSVKFDYILTDPPYGGNFDTNYKRFTGGVSDKNKYEPITGDDVSFDASAWASRGKALMFGYQFWASTVSTGTVLVWKKKRDSKLGKMLSDAELAWMNHGCGVYIFDHEWDGFMRASERGKSLHPTQKPVALMEWCLEKLGVKEGETVFDPFMGVGATGIACVKNGINFIGCEIVPKYYQIAKQRIEAAA
jgi:site-specific DNA-methyltransferase (adenine-specific)